ncbi:MAG TPA: DUF167 domain-containing protein [Caulobacteraceae bacterium]|nr:DUF167 domain-containing protein [Caulobacteraceae bacterium]
MPSPERARLVVRLTPKGGRDAVEGWTRGVHGERQLKARVSAPPTDGAANAALVRLIAKALGCPRSAVRIASGAQSRVKRLEIEGSSADDLLRAFGPPD